MDDLSDSLKALYPKDADRLYNEIITFMKDVPKRKGTSDNVYWYKNTNLYVVYPDGLNAWKSSAFERLTAHLDYIKKLGFNAMHVLPFLDSPMVDKGFDISDFHKIRPDLGTIHDLKKFKRAADQKEVRIFMDLVFNHVSDQHEWFKKAERGDDYYRNYFIYTSEKPIFIRKFHKESAVWAEYEVAGKNIVANIAFPEYTGPIPHWRQGKDGYWYYHTYYPQQLDVNWNNPNVFLEFSKIVMQWASLGFHFRMDAIPFVGKGAYKQIDEVNETTFKIIAALNSIADEIYPECAFIVETYERIETAKAYFGTSNITQAELSYNFHLCTYLWVSLVTQNIDYLWSKLDELLDIPKHGEWINFLRNHDELSLAYLDPDLNKTLNKELQPNGAPFRENYGIAGRTYSLLGGTLKRFLMAYFLLYSIPGSVAMVYGDECGAKNIPLHTLHDKEKKDTRNINRGTLTKTQMKTKKSQRINGLIQEMLKQRRVLAQYQNIQPERWNTFKDKEVFSAVYRLGRSQLIILINLSKKKKTISFDTHQYKTLVTVNSVQVRKDCIKLGQYGGIWIEK